MKKAAFMVALVMVLGSPALGQTVCQKSRGQTVYVQAGYNDFTSLVGQVEKSATSLVIYNSDRQTSITLKSVKFYNPQGAFVKEYLSAPQSIPPLASVSFITDFASLGVNPYDGSGGRPTFMVQWEAGGVVCAPVIESRMVMGHDYSGSWGFVGMSFASGIVLEDLGFSIAALSLLLR